MSVLQLATSCSCSAVPPRWSEWARMSTFYWGMQYWEA